MPCLVVAAFEADECRVRIVPSATQENRIDVLEKCARRSDRICCRKSRDRRLLPCPLTPNQMEDLRFALLARDDRRFMLRKVRTAETVSEVHHCCRCSNAGIAIGKVETEPGRPNGMNSKCARVGETRRL